MYTMDVESSTDLKSMGIVESKQNLFFNFSKILQSKQDGKQLWCYLVKCHSDEKDQERKYVFDLT